MSQRQSGYPRQPNETYETPSWVVQVVAQYLRKHCLHIWAPADEESSRLVLALRAEGFTVTATADDFLVRTCLPHSRIDAVTTNPPFGQGGRLACQFIAHALELVPIVAMLLRIDFDSGKTRTNLFRDCPAFAHKISTLEPAMVDIHTEIIWCVFGNPLHNTGPFRECFGRFAHRWQRWHVDARDVGISDKKQIAEWAEDHAEDSYFFMSRVRGLFPVAGALQFIPTDLVEAAMVRDVKPLPNDPLVVGVDVARFGDDSSVIYARRGMDARSILPIEVRGASTDRLEDLILQFCTQHRVEVIFIDGSGVGGGVVDHLANRHNLPVEDVQFGSKALNATSQVRYAQKRSEMWGLMRDALKYLAIPNRPDLKDQLISLEYDFNLRGELQLEKKSDMKRRGLVSPDIADALALTFARPVMPRMYDDWMGTGNNVISEYDPIEEFEREVSGKPRTPQRYY